jgi:hypothetical protein
MPARMKSRGGSGVESQAPRQLADVRALEPVDLPEATALFELVMGSEIGQSKQGIGELFERTLLDSPWSDPELPSLVAIDEHGRMIGFIGTEVRRMRLGKRSARAVWCQHFVVDPAARHLGVGAVLLRRVLKGPQDATFTDNGSDVVRQMWGGLGGQALDLKGIHWVRVFRPWQVAAHTAAPRARPRLRAPLRRLSGPLDNASVAVAGRFLAPAATCDAAAALTPQTLLEALPTVARRMRLYPDYDEPFLDWLFEELTRVESRGRLVAHLVRDPSGPTAGW